MFRLFTGPARILGVRDRRRNCKGFEGGAGTVERGTPGWMPSLAAGRDVEISSFEAELRDVLQEYGLKLDQLPQRLREAITVRQSFTLVEGEGPVSLYKGKIEADDLAAAIVRHEQSVLCLEQVDFFAAHNGRLLNEGRRLVLPPISPYAGFEVPSVFPIPEQLPIDAGQLVSTTEGGSKEAGRLTLHTSSENMPAAYRNLKPRWQIIYRTRHQMIGAKAVAEVVGATPGTQYIYGTVELAALEPAYVEHGRRRPKPGPLVEAIDRFVAEKVRELAHQINARRQEKLDERSLDEVQKENQKLDEFKNQFLPTFGSGKQQGVDDVPPPPPTPPEWGTEPEALDYLMPAGGIHVAQGVSLPLRQLLGVRVKDPLGKPVRAPLEWNTSDAQVANIQDHVLDPKQKGRCEVWVRVKGTRIESERIPVTVWSIDHVLLTPRNLDIPLGTRQPIVAEVTDDDGRRSTEVLLDWRHDAEDQLIVRLGRDGLVTANRFGRTAVTAGAGSLWARIPVEVRVLENPDKLRQGGGFPKLLLTGRDVDPATGVIREGDPDQPPLWQETSDFMNNVWWLNLQSPEAAGTFRQRGSNPVLWRTYHAERVIDMVVQVWMREEYTRKGESERQDYWSAHLASMDRHRVRLVQQMWKRLAAYVADGGQLELGA